MDLLFMTAKDMTNQDEIQDHMLEVHGFRFISCMSTLNTGL